MITSAKFTLSNTVPTKIVEANMNPQEVHLHNMTKSSNQYIHIGGPNVSTTNSIHIDPAGSMTIKLGPSDDLWAVSDPGGLEVSVLTVVFS